jgi:hypothetical protein
MANCIKTLSAFDSMDLLVLDTAIPYKRIVCSTKNSLAASHDKSEVCLSTSYQM